MMIRTESSLLPSISPPSATNHPPSSDFLAAVADPDFAYPQVTNGSRFVNNAFYVVISALLVAWKYPSLFK